MKLVDYRKIVFLFIILVLSFGLVLGYDNVKADSGWDSSYSSGGSYSSGSSHSSGSSSRDYSYSYDYSKSNRSKSSEPFVYEPSFIPLYGFFSNFMGFIVVLFICSIIKYFKEHSLELRGKEIIKPFLLYTLFHIIYLVSEYIVSIFNRKLFVAMWYVDFVFPIVMAFIIFLFLAIYSFYLIGKYIVLNIYNFCKKISFKIYFYNDVFIPNELKSYLGCQSIGDVKKILFDNFVNIQNAWMDFNYDELKRLCSNEIYNTYHEELEALKLKHGKNIMNKFVLNKNSIYKISKEGKKYKLYYYLDVSFIDYVLNTNTNKVMHGRKTIPLNNCYLLEFDVYCSNEENKCPHCGAVLEDDNDVCKYCKASINRESKHIIMTSKRLY